MHTKALSTWLSSDNLSFIQHTIRHLDNALRVIVQEQSHSLQHILRTLKVLAVKGKDIFLSSAHLGHLVMVLNRSLLCALVVLLLLVRLHRLLVMVVVRHRPTS
jgi:hypothetical protein